MYFERLRIQGFKSFVERTDIEFRPGITAIVGPNGCGKSNISDAIRWVLGEQNIRMLRGNRLEDLIFNGSPKRKPVGMAEVTLTVQSTGELPRALHGQIEITRRLFRDGESEFYINRVACRLKDIVELFMDSGLGKGSYAMIEQGKVDLVLRCKPKERRLLVEEAAGIIRYKSKKEEALKKIGNTHQNLLRIEDRLYELENIADTLKKQAKRAKRYRQDRSTLLDMEKNFASYRLRTLQVEIDEITTKSKDLFDEITKLETQIATCARDKSIKEEHLERLRDELNGFFARKSSLDKEVDLSLQNIDFSQTRIVELTSELENLDFEIEELQEKKESSLFDYNQLDAELETLAGKTAVAENEVQQKQELMEEMTEQFTGQTDLKEQKQREHLKTISRSSQLHQQKTRIHSILEEIGRRETRLQKERKECDLKRQQSIPRKAKIETSLAGIDGQLDDLMNKRQTFEDKKRTEQQNHTVLQQEMEKWNEELFRKEARLQSLQEMERSLEGYSPGIQSLLSDMNSDESVPANMTLVADHIRINREKELAVLLAIRSYLDTIVVENTEKAVQLATFVQEHSLGRVSFLPLTQFDGDDNRAPDHGTADEIEGLPRLRQFVDCDRELVPVVDRLLGSFVLAASIPDALEHQTQSDRELTYVTPDGSIIDPHGIIRVGQELDRTIEIYSRKQEISDLEQDIISLGSRLEDIRDRKSEHEKVLERLKHASDDCEQQKHSLQLSKQGFMKDLESVNKEQRQYEEAVTVSRLEIEQLQFDRDHHLNEITELDRLIADTEKQQKNLENIISELDEKITELHEQKERIQSELTDARVQWTSLKEKVDNAHRTLAAHQDMIDEYDNQVRRNERRIKEANSQKTSLEQTIVTTDTKLKVLHSDLDELNQSIDESTHQFQEMKSKAEKESEWERVLQKTVAPLKERYSDLQVTLKSLEFQLNHVREDITNRLKCSIEELETHSFHLADDNEVSKYKKKIELCQRRLEGYDDLNLSAPEEYDAMRAKIDDMTDQKKDVLDAIDTLQLAVTKIDRETQQRFRTCFDEVNSNFQALFQRLFGGGFAELQLEEEDDLLETGITIVAQPPGKKLQTLSLLSGGEKALTAIAFLVAIFYYRPSPLCFLDEVDAALDEVNTVRFSRLLKEMSTKAQIIMITHSKNSIEIANVFYGVTMSDPGISRIISLELEEASEEQLTA